MWAWPLEYREQSSDLFSRPVGKEIRYANAHRSPHHFTQNARYGAANRSASPFHPAIAGLTRSHCLKGGRGGPTDQLKIGHELGCSNLTVGKWRRRYLALGLPGLQDAIRSGRPRTIAAPTRVQVISVASTLPHAQDRTVTRWTLDEIVATLLEALHTDGISRSSIWRILQDVDLKPHKSAYWLNSHDEDFEVKAHNICQLYAKALALLPAKPFADLLRRENRHASARTQSPHQTRQAGPTRTTRT